jgi:hypothetical protein
MKMRSLSDDWTGLDGLLKPLIKTITMLNHPNIGF